MDGATDRGIAILQARMSIERLMHEYAERVDGGDMEGVGELFATGKVVMPGGSELVGAKAVRDGYVDAVQFYDADGQPAAYERSVTTPRTRHMVFNHLFDFNNLVTVANTRVVFMVTQVIDEQLVPIVGGRYVDEFAKELGGWRFVRREIFIDQVGDNSRHSAAEQ